MTWTNVRQLASYGDTTFAYGADGIRYRKGNTYYTLDGNRILREFNNTYGEILYYYGVNGIVGFRYGNADYYYRKNIFGDIVAIHNAYGTEVATYTYDAWGKIVAFTDTSGLEIANRNPFRYRSYYYDTETSLYYLESRYYDPETGRFINADSLDYLGEGAELCNHNLFAYCGNNPVMCSDPTGYFGILGTLLVSTLVGFAVGGGIEIAKQAFNGGDLNFDFETWDWGEIGCKAILGAATGFAYGAGGVAGGIVKGSIATIGTLTKVQSIGILLGTTTAMNFAAGVGVSVAHNLQNRENIDVLKATSAGIGQAGKGGFSFFTGGMYSASSIWNVGKGAHNSLYSIVARSAGRSLISFIPNMIFSMFE